MARDAGDRADRALDLDLAHNVRNAGRRRRRRGRDDAQPAALAGLRPALRGYFLSKPLKADDVVPWLRTAPRAHPAAQETPELRRVVWAG